MIRRFIDSFVLIFALTAFFYADVVLAEESVFNPSDPLITYNPLSPPQVPVWGKLSRWVRTQRLGFDTSSYKSYFYKGMAFRLKFPRSFSVADKNKKYPLLIFFHGRSETGDIFDNEQQLYHGGRELGSAVDSGVYDGFLLFPQSSSSSGIFSQGHFQALLELIDNYFVPQLHIDRHRVVVHGVSSGAHSALIMAYKFPSLMAAVIPISPSVERLTQPEVMERYQYTPLWFFFGRQRIDPTIAEVRDVVRIYQNNGAPFYYTEYPLRRHRCWRDAWNEPEFFRYLTHVHQANPWPRYGRTRLCPGKDASTVLGVVAGYDGYEWRKNGEVIPDAISNAVEVRGEGTYEARIKKGGEWSEWSPVPVQIEMKCPEIKISTDPPTPVSMVVPPFESTSKLKLRAPSGFSKVHWQKKESSALIGETVDLDVSEPGSYRAIITDSTNTQITSDWMTIVENNNQLSLKSLTVEPVTQQMFKLNWELDPKLLNPVSIEVYRSESKIDKVFPLKELAPDIEKFSGSLPISDKDAGLVVGVELANGSVIAVYPDRDLREIAGDVQKIDLSWSYQGIDRKLIKKAGIYRTTFKGTPLKLYSVLAGTKREFLDAAVDGGNLYSYGVRAVYKDSATKVMQSQARRTLADIQPPTAPQALQQLPIFGGNLKLFWKSSEDETGSFVYKVFLNGKMIAENGEPLAIIEAKDLTDRNVVVVRARDNSGNESVSSEPFEIIKKSNGVEYAYSPLIEIPGAPGGTVAWYGDQATGIDRNFLLTRRLADKRFAVRWRAKLNLKKSGEYLFRLTSSGESTLSFPDLDQTQPPFLSQDSNIPVLVKDSKRELSEGQVLIFVTFIHSQGEPQFTLWWKVPGENDFVPVPDHAFIQ